MQNIPPNRIRNDQTEESRINKEWKEQYSGEEMENKEKDTEGRQRSLLQAKFIKDPERRLYYYVEHK